MIIHDYDGIAWDHEDILPCGQCYYKPAHCKCGGIIHYQYEDDSDEAVSVSEHCTKCNDPIWAGEIVND